MTASTPRPRSPRNGVTGLLRRIVALEARVGNVESHQNASETTHAALALADSTLAHADSETAAAVRELSRIINDPEHGLIVGLREFKTEVASDRKIQRAYIAGAVLVLSVVWTILLAIAPAIRGLLGT